MQINKISIESVTSKEKKNREIEDYRIEDEYALHPKEQIEVQCSINHPLVSSLTALQFHCYESPLDFLTGFQQIVSPSVEPKCNVLWRKNLCKLCVYYQQVLLHL